MGDGAVPFSKFVRLLKVMNPKIVCDIPSPKSRHRGVMVYLRAPKHPDSDPETGLWEVLAVPSPIYLPMTPKHDPTYKGLDGSEKWVRGWDTFFKAVCKMEDPTTGLPIFSKSRVKGLFPGAFDNFNSRAFQAEVFARSNRVMALAKTMADKRYVFDPREMPSYMGG